VRTASGAVRGIWTAPNSASQMTIGGLANGTGHTFRVRAVNELGKGAWSAASALATPRTTPAAVASVDAKPGAARGKVTASVSWKPGSTGGSPIKGFRVTVQRLTAKGAATGAPLVLTLPASARTATINPGVRAGTRYRFTVQQINAVGTGPGRTDNTTVR
jgi:hypothetical protein